MASKKKLCLCAALGARVGDISMVPLLLEPLSMIQDTPLKTFQEAMMSLKGIIKRIKVLIENCLTFAEDFIDQNGPDKHGLTGLSSLID